MAYTPTITEQSTTRIRIIRGVSFFSLIPILAPVAGFIAGVYMAYNGLEKHDGSKTIFYYILSEAIKFSSVVVAGGLSGIIGMFLPPGLSAMPVGAFMGFSKAIIDLVHDRKTGKPIGVIGGLKRIGGALLGAIPLLGPTISDGFLKKVSADFKNPPPKKPYDETKILKFFSICSCVPFLAPFIGLAGGAYTAYRKSKAQMDTKTQIAIKTLVGGSIGVAAGTLGAFLLPVVSSVPVSLAISSIEASMDAIKDKQVGRIGIVGSLARIRGALMGAIPIFGLTLSHKMLEKSSKNFNNSHSAPNTAPPAPAPAPVPAAAPAPAAVPTPPHAHHPTPHGPPIPPAVPNKKGWRFWR